MSGPYVTELWTYSCLVPEVVSPDDPFVTWFDSLHLQEPDEGGDVRSLPT
jgi:hypothetical protein